jgi:hypothetical protein
MERILKRCLAYLREGAYDDVCGAKGILVDECVSVWTIPSVLRYFYLLWEVCALTRSVLLGNGVNNLDQSRVTYKKYRH